MTEIRCEMFCDKPIGPDGDPGGDGWKATCKPCEGMLTWLCREVLPSIRKNGFYVPNDADVDEEMRALIDQQGLRESMNELLAAMGIKFPEESA